MKRKRYQGFTLLELIVVITIIGILGTFVVMRVSGSTAKARVMKAKSDVRIIYDAAVSFEAQTGDWPDSVDELVNARDPDTGMLLPGTLPEVPKDPWKNEYLFEMGDDGPVVITYGKDGSPGGEAESQDHQHPEGDDGSLGY